VRSCDCSNLTMAHAATLLFQRRRTTQTSAAGTQTGHRARSRSAFSSVGVAQSPACFRKLPEWVLLHSFRERAQLRAIAMVVDEDHLAMSVRQRLDERRQVEEVRAAVAQDENAVMWPVAEDRADRAASCVGQDAARDLPQHDGHVGLVVDAAVHLDDADAAVCRDARSPRRDRARQGLGRAALRISPAPAPAANRSSSWRSRGHIRPLRRRPGRDASGSPCRVRRS